MNAIEKYIDANRNLIEAFFVKYYNWWKPTTKSDLAYYVNEIWLENHGFWVINISDDYVNMEMIYTAMKYWISEKIFFDWYHYQLEWHTEEKKWYPTNLYSFYLQNK